LDRAFHSTSVSFNIVSSIFHTHFHAAVIRIRSAIGLATYPLKHAFLEICKVEKKSPCTCLNTQTTHKADRLVRHRFGITSGIKQVTDVTILFVSLRQKFVCIYLDASYFREVKTLTNIYEERKLKTFYQNKG
jgi:predicted transcriptional regulator